MRVGILNLPFDNNYGGNLQRYALARVLWEMGHDVKHINLRNSYCLPFYKKPYCYAKRLLMKLLGSKSSIFLEQERKREDERMGINAQKFDERYVSHTRAVYGVKEIGQVCRENKFQAVVVGSDQVWRNGMVKGVLGLNNYMLGFIHDEHIKKIAYAVSLGTEQRLGSAQVQRYSKFYNKFSAVSVRESQSVALFDEYGWTEPRAQHVLDPVFLLKKEDYVTLTEKETVEHAAKNRIFCYILDTNKRIEDIIRCKERELESASVTVGLKDTEKVSVEQWLYNIYTCRLMITDSFHGVAFSILFNKPFVFCGNEKRGNIRLRSLYKMFMIDSEQTEHLDWQAINRKIEQFRRVSEDFLNHSLRAE